MTNTARQLLDAETIDRWIEAALAGEYPIGQDCDNLRIHIKQAIHSGQMTYEEARAIREGAPKLAEAIAFSAMATPDQFTARARSGKILATHVMNGLERAASDARQGNAQTSAPAAHLLEGEDPSAVVMHFLYEALRTVDDGQCSNGETIERAAKMVMDSAQDGSILLEHEDFMAICIHGAQVIGEIK